MIYSIDKQINGKFAVVVIDTDKDNNYVQTVVTDWIHGSFRILYNGKKVGEISAGSTSINIMFNKQVAYIEYVYGAMFPRIHTAPGDLLIFEEVR